MVAAPCLAGPIEDGAARIDDLATAAGAHSGSSGSWSAKASSPNLARHFALNDPGYFGTREK